MARFYELQLDYYSRRGLLLRFSTALTYHLNAFYLLLWGMLEQLTVIAKHVRNLQIDDRLCGIRSAGFWKEFTPTAAGLRQFMKGSAIDNWIDRMADLRHTAAHRTIVIPGPVFEETRDSEKPEAEIFVQFRNRSGTVSADLADLEASLSLILASYVDVKGEPVKNCAVSCLSDRSLTWDVTVADHDRIQQATALLSLAAMASNDYFQSLGCYANSTAFQFFLQNFTEPVEFITLRVRRRDGHIMDGGYKHGEV